MTLNTFMIIVNIVVIGILLYYIYKLKEDIVKLKEKLDIMLTEYTLFVKAAGVAEGTAKGIACQEEKQKKINEGLEKEFGSQEIIGTVIGTIKPVIK